MSFFYKQDEDVKAVNIVIAAIGLLLSLWVAILVVAPRYRVYSSTQSGKAELAQAEWNRLIKVREAQAALDSASLNAQAEVKRAEGVAAANKIVADGLGGPEGYLRYLYIDMLRDQQGTQTIYIPTEAGLPILEAGKR